MQMRIFFSLAFLSLFFGIRAQDMTAPLLSGSWQSTFTNPALLHRLDGKLTIGLPGLHSEFTTSDFSYNDLISEDESGEFFDANRAISNLDVRNELRNEFSFETVGFAWRGDKLALGFSHRNRFTGLVDLPKTLIQTVYQGNAQFIGETIDIAPYFQLTSINEFNFSAALQISDVLSVGGTLKYLSGAADARAEGGEILLTTSDDVYQLTLQPDYVINSSNTLDYNGVDDLSVDIDPARFNLDNLGRNSGIGFDVGVALDFDNFRLQASALDLGGSIDWTEDVTILRLTGDNDFEGLDIIRELLDDSTSFDGILDTLEGIFDPLEVKEDYSTSTGSTYLLGGEFDLTDQLMLGALLRYQDYGLNNEVTAALSARYLFADFLSVGGIYSYRPNSPANIGVNAVLALGPVNLLLATDNVITIFNPKDAKQASARLGLSLSFGRGDNDE
ncbi:hypothetical protein CEQ90_08295 [Lewinellaceae bacterium SD302]|nr:hypothetical protein CEQ90_08295 [Lewinellaceae bacterium SD302]